MDLFQDFGLENLDSKQAAIICFHDKETTRGYLKLNRVELEKSLFQSPILLSHANLKVLFIPDLSLLCHVEISLHK